MCLLSTLWNYLQPALPLTLTVSKFGSVKPQGLWQLSYWNEHCFGAISCLTCVILFAAIALHGAATDPGGTAGTWCLIKQHSKYLHTSIMVNFLYYPWRKLRAMGDIHVKCIESVASWLKMLMWEMSSSVVLVHSCQVTAFRESAEKVCFLNSYWIDHYFSFTRS